MSGSGEATSAGQISSHANFAGKIYASTVNSVCKDMDMVEWIVDTWASDHMVGNYNLITQFVSISETCTH